MVEEVVKAPKGKEVHQELLRGVVATAGSEDYGYFAEDKRLDVTAMSEVLVVL